MFSIPQPLQTHCSVSKQATCSSNTQLLPLERNTLKSLLQRKPSRQLCLKKQRQKLLQLVQASQALLGMGLNGSFPWGTYFFFLPYHFLQKTARLAAQPGLLCGSNSSNTISAIGILLLSLLCCTRTGAQGAPSAEFNREKQCDTKLHSLLRLHSISTLGSPFFGGNVQLCPLQACKGIPELMLLPDPHDSV